MSLGLEELVNVPFVSGVLYAKVRLLEGGGFTEQSPRQEVGCLSLSGVFASFSFDLGVPKKLPTTYTVMSVRSWSSLLDGS